MTRILASFTKVRARQSGEGVRAPTVIPTVRGLRKVCFVSGTRAEFGLMRTTLEAIEAHEKLGLQLVCTGMHLDPAHALWFLPMNTRIPPFHDARVRRAVVMALDRRAAVKLFGGPRLAEPLCQALPPGLPGHSPYCPYPHDPAAARRLVAESGMAGRRVTLVTDDSAVQRAIGAYVLSALQGIGLDARTRALSANLQYTYIQNTENNVQISLTAWYADYPSASTILVPNFSCAAWRPGSDASTNIAGLCDPAVEAALQAAQAAPSEAAWAAADRAVTDTAAAAVLFTPRYVNLVSRRVGGFAYHDQYRWLIARAWVR